MTQIVRREVADGYFTIADWEIVRKGAMSLDDVRLAVIIRQIDYLIDREKKLHGTDICVEIKREWTKVRITPGTSAWRVFSYFFEMQECSAREFMLTCEIGRLTRLYFGPSVWYHNRPPRNNKGKPQQVNRDRDHSLSDLESRYREEIRKIDMRNPMRV